MSEIAYCYIRMSNEEQEKGDSRRRQLDLATKYAAAHKLEMTTTFEGQPFEDVGLSALFGEHVTTGRLGKFLAAVDAGRIPKGTILLIEALDRLSRQDFITAQIQLLTILKHGVIVITTSDNRTYSKDGDQLTLLTGGMIQSQANLELVKRQQRLLETNANKRENTAKRKLTKWCPAWLEVDEYDYSGKRPIPKSFKPIKQRVDIVQRIFEECAAGRGSNLIADGLYADGIEPFGRSRGVVDKTTKELVKNPNHRWHASSVEKILSNRAVLGEYQFYKTKSKKPYVREKIPGKIDYDYYPKIIKPSLWKRAEASRASRKIVSANGKVIGKGGSRGQRINNLFSGLTICGYCGGTIQYANKDKAGEKTRHSYFICYSGKACTKPKGIPNWRYPEFERSFLTAVREFDFEALASDEEQAIKRNDLFKKIQEDEGEMIELERQRENCRISIRLAPSEAVIADATSDLGICLDKIAALKIEITSKENELAAMKAEAQDRFESRDLKVLIERVQTGTDPQTFKLRAEIQRKMNAIISQIVMAPAKDIYQIKYSADGGGAAMQIMDLENCPGTLVVKFKGGPSHDFVKANPGKSFIKNDDGTFTEGSIWESAPE